MKYKILLLLIISSFCYSQNGIIRYGYIDAIGIGNAKGQDSNAYMLFNKEMSYYVTAKDSLEKAEDRDRQTINEDEENGGGTINNGMKTSIQGDQVVYDKTKKTMWSNLLFIKQYYVKEVAPEISWKIEKNTKLIGKFICKKATANFRGREYTAWYTTEIPVPFGPWKLHGLPGLILEAYDTNKNVYWYFKSIEYPTSNKNKPISIRKAKSEKDIKFLTYKEFKKVQQDEIKRVDDKQKILGKEYPNVTFITPKLNQLFIECE